MVILALSMGAVLITLVFVQAVLAVYSSMIRVAHERQQDQLSVQLLWERIELARHVRADQEQRQGSWSGYRKFVVDRKVHEAENICSFYLKPHDGKKLPPFQPGQFLTFQLHVANHDKPVIRCYSLSDNPNSDYYRVTIKRLAAPPDQPDVQPGLASNHFHQHVNEGDILDVRAPNGKFVLDMSRKRPVVLIGGGVGITPFLCMLNTVIQKGCDRPVWLFYGMRHGGEAVQPQHLKDLCKQHEQIQVVTCYSDPRPEDVLGQDYDHRGRVSAKLLREKLGTSNYEFFLCGPPAMMDAVQEMLKAWGVPQRDIILEAFNAQSVSKPKAADTVALQQLSITFSKSKTNVSWSETRGSILELAEENGISLDYACRTGSCKTCQVAVKSGSVEYLSDPDCDVDQGCCLPCIAQPKCDIILDA